MQVAADPEHAPPQPVNVELLGDAVKVTTSLAAKLNAHVPVVQVIPPGELLTVPEPVPAMVTLS